MTLPLLFAESFAGFGVGATFTPSTADLAGKIAIAITRNVGTDYGRNGGYGVRVNAGGVQEILATPRASLGVVFAVRITAAAVDHALVGDCRTSDGWQIMAWSRLATGAVQLSTTDGGLLATTPAGSLPADGAWHTVELQVVLGRLDGAIYCWTDDVPAAAGFGPVWRTGTANDIASTEVSVANPYLVDLCDWVGYDCAAAPGSARLGPVAVIPLTMTGAGTGDVGAFAQTGGTGGVPTTAVTDNPHDGTTSYLSDATVGDQVTFTVSPFPTPLTPYGPIIAVAVNAIAMGDVVGRSLATVARAGGVAGVNTVGASVAVTTTPTNVQQFAATDPSTGAAWTGAGVTAMEVGVKVTG